jgi:hypothetical protein
MMGIVLHWYHSTHTSNVPIHALAALGTVSSFIHYVAQSLDELGFDQAIAWQNIAQYPRKNNYGLKTDSNSRIDIKVKMHPCCITKLT